MESAVHAASSRWGRCPIPSRTWNVHSGRVEARARAASSLDRGSSAPWSHRVGAAICARWRRHCRGRARTLDHLEDGAELGTLGGAAPVSPGGLELLDRGVDDGRWNALSVGGGVGKLSGDELLRSHARDLSAHECSHARQTQERELGGQPRIAGPARHVGYRRVEQHQALDSVGLAERVEDRDDGAHGVTDEDDRTIGLHRNQCAEHAQLGVECRLVRRGGEGPAVAEQVGNHHAAPFGQHWAHQVEVERRSSEAVQADHELGGIRRAVLGEVDDTVEVDRAGTAS